MAIHNHLTGCEPKLLDNFDCSETSGMTFQDRAKKIRSLRTRAMRNSTMRLSGKALSSPLFIQEREEPANLRQAYHSHEESLLPAQSFFAHTSTERPEDEPSSSQKRKSGRDMENDRIRILRERQKEQILAEVRTEIQKHEFQADSDRRSVQEVNGTTESQRREIDHTVASDEQLRRDQLLLQEQQSEHNRDLREARIRSLHEMEELKRVQELRVDESFTDLIDKRTTTTTSRKLLKRRRKYLRLQADTRLKFNREDLPLLAHLQELFIFLNENGLILNQELNTIKRTQWQKE